MDAAAEDFGRAHSWTAARTMVAKRICYRTVWTECDWRNYANRGVPGSILYVPNDGYPSHGGDLNSVGLYQQRAQWWGDTAGSMDPHTATTRFLTVMADIPNWWTVNQSDVCQMVQRSQFDGVTVNPVTGKPYPYAQNYRDRSAQTAAIEADDLYFTNQTKEP